MFLHVLGGSKNGDSSLLFSYIFWEAVKKMAIAPPYFLRGWLLQLGLVGGLDMHVGSPWVSELAGRTSQPRPPWGVLEVDERAP